MKILDKIKGVGPSTGLAIAAGLLGLAKMVVDSKVKANDKNAFKDEIVNEALNKMREEFSKEG